LVSEASFGGLLLGTPQPGQPPILRWLQAKLDVDHWSELSADHWQLLLRLDADPAGNPALSSAVNEDRLQGKAGNDWLFGGSGPDLAEGGTGADLVLGGTGNDVLYGYQATLNLIEQFADGDDALYGGDGNDEARGGIGNDLLSGGRGNDKLVGDDSDDPILITRARPGQNYAGLDLLAGGTGNDTLFGALGADVLFAGEGLERAERDVDHRLLRRRQEDDRAVPGSRRLSR
jgi:Ca2+-binding RTX toxin-like protein